QNCVREEMCKLDCRGYFKRIDLQSTSETEHHNFSYLELMKKSDPVLNPVQELSHSLPHFHDSDGSMLDSQDDCEDVKKRTKGEKSW
ncbi:hypothetical protein Ciccas_013299, partial [Cichlidogyrus casuarinus]